MSKVDKAIGPMQAALKESLKESKAANLGTRVMDLGQNSTDDRLKKYFGSLFVLPVCTKQSIDANARGSDIMQKVLDTANKGKKYASIFLVNLRNNTEGRTIGIHCQDELHFFDSNLGEFEFPKGSENDPDNFLDEWWQTFYMLPGQKVPVQYFDRWGLESVQLKKQQQEILL